MMRQQQARTSDLVNGESIVINKTQE